MCRGYSELEDLEKTELYGRAEWRHQCVPEDALDPGTKDPGAGADRGSDRGTAARPAAAKVSECAVLDAMLTGLTEQEYSVDEIVRVGHDRCCPLINRFREG